MSSTWMTKYGERRVRQDAPTLDEALFAAQGLMLDAEQQIHFAADLLQVPIDQIRAEAERWIKSQVSEQAPRSNVVALRRPSRTVVVERKMPRRVPPAATARSKTF